MHCCDIASDWKEEAYRRDEDQPLMNLVTRIELVLITYISGLERPNYNSGSVMRNGKRVLPACLPCLASANANADDLFRAGPHDSDASKEGGFKRH